MIVLIVILPAILLHICFHTPVQTFLFEEEAKFIVGSQHRLLMQADLKVRAMYTFVMGRR
jgi:hypothetical protein